MGDDAELYWEMEHDPFFWNQVERYNESYSIPKKKSAKKKENDSKEKQG